MLEVAPPMAPSAPSKRPGGAPPGEDTVPGFKEAAHDYLTKRFRFEELLAPVRMRLRGSGGAEAAMRAGPFTPVRAGPGGGVHGRTHGPGAFPASASRRAPFEYWTVSCLQSQPTSIRTTSN